MDNQPFADRAYLGTKSVEISKMSCRLCLKRSENMIILWSNDSLQSKIREYLSIDVNDCKELPNKICTDCQKKLEDFSAFKQFSCMADRILRNALKTNTLHIFIEDSTSAINDFGNKKIIQSDAEVNSFEISECDETSNLEEIVVEDTSDMDCIFNEYEEDCVAENIVIQKADQGDCISDCKPENVKTEVDVEEDLEDTGIYYPLEENGGLEICFVCKQCSKEFTSMGEFTSHQSICELSSEDNLECFVCGKMHNFKEELFEHIKTHMSQLLDSDLDDKIFKYISKSQKESNEITGKVKCPLCTKLMFPQSLRAHMLKHTDRFKCPQCSARHSSRANLWIHIKSFHTNIRDQICNICGKGFAYAGLLKVHMESHSEVRQYKCQLCSYAGRTGSALRAHSKTHQTDRPHLCDMCAKTFKTISELRIHKRRTHLGERKFQCQLCGQAFFQHHRLVIHMRIHTGDKPYTCKICNNKYGRSDALHEHMKVHENPIHECQRCLKKYRTQKRLRKHICW